MHLQHCDQLQAEAIRRCKLDQIAAITVVAHARAPGGGFPDASQLLSAGRVHPVCIAYGTCSLHARKLAQMGNQRLPSA
jgi:hypothetical protein